ncbi:MAG: PD-(D/E)XK nuclease family protein [Bifidobacteriaceae bacterium]|nr:PD-(D/E)XK nuclease family protein [Bifidobacteriaceae bacterium]
MPSKPSTPAISPSRAQDFQQCPLLFRFRVVDKLPEPPSLAAAKGTLVHKVLEHLFDLPASERTIDAALAHLPDAYRAVTERDPSIPTLFATESDRRAWLAEAETLLRTYFTLENPCGLAPAAREMFVQTDIALPDSQEASDAEPQAGGTVPEGGTVAEGGTVPEDGAGDDGVAPAVPGRRRPLRLRGFIDRLDVAPGSGALRVVDYKTGKAPNPRFQGKVKFQLDCYSLALWRKRGAVPAMEQLIYMGSGDVLRFEPTQAELEATEAQLVALWESIERTARSGTWPASRSRLCDWCHFQAQCPEFGGQTPPLPDDALARLGLA